MRRRRNQRGISIIEVMFYGAIASVSGLMIAKLLRQPVNMAQALSQAAQQQMADQAAVLPVDDIKCAWGATIQWNALDQSLPAYNTTTGPTLMPWFQVHNQPGQSTPFAYVCYAYRASDSSVVREFSINTPVHLTQCNPGDPDAAVKETVIARQVALPTVANPMFSKDPAASDVIIFSLQFTAPLGSGLHFKPVSLVRRAHIRS